MATDVTPDAKVLRGLLVPDSGVTWSTYSGTLSSVTQAGPLPGIPAPEQGTDMVLRATGSQSANKRLRVQTLRAGMPAPDEAGFCWYYGSEQKRGWDPPVGISWWEAIDWTNTANQWRNPCAVTCADGTVVVLVEYSRAQIYAWRRDPSTGAWSSTSVYTHGTYAERAHCAPVLLPDGKILVFFWVEDADLNQNQVRCHYSSDNGATWSLYNRGCLRTPLDVSGTVTPGRLRAAYNNGQILLVAHLNDSSNTWFDVFAQYGSNDLGASFTLVNTWTGSAESESGAYQDIVVDAGTFYFAYLRKQATPSPATALVIPHWRRISNAFEPLASAEEEGGIVEYGASGNAMSWGTEAGGELTAGDFALWKDDDGAFYVAGRDHDAGAGNEIHVYRSVDGGVTWDVMGISTAAGDGAVTWRDGSTGRYLQDFCAVAQGGRSLLIHRFSASASGFGPSLCAAYLGGYTTTTLPALYGYLSAAQRVAFERVWLPFDLPDAAAMWTLATLGAPTAAITLARLRLDSAVGETIDYTATPATSTLTQGVIALVDCLRLSGAGDAYVRVRVGVATPTSYELNVSITTTSIVIKDGVSGSTLTTVSTTLGATGVQLLIAVSNPATAPANDGLGKVWYRASDGDTDREWTLGHTATTLQAGLSNSNRVKFGHNGEAASRWRIVSFSSGAYTGQQLTEFSNPTDLLPRSYSATPQYVDDGVKIAASSGPTVMNEIFDIDTRYQYGVEYAMPDFCASPARTWRSTDETQQDIVWEYDSTLGEEAPQLGPTLGIYLGNINFKAASLWGYDVDTAAYVKLCDINAADGQASLRWIRQGHRVVVDTGATLTNADEYFHENMLAGSHFVLSGGSPVVRKIRTNSGGAWTNLTTKRARLELEGVTGTDPSSGTAGEVWSKEVCVLVNNATKYSRYRLRIGAQDTAEGYFYIGAIIIGRLVTFARQYSLGRKLVWEPNAEITTRRSGARDVTVHGATRRSATIQWIEGVVTGPTSKTTPTPNYILPYVGSTEPIGAPAETPLQMAGIVEALQGPKGLCVYLPYVPVRANSSAVTTIVGRTRMLYGRITSPVTLTAVLGNENESELVTVEAVTIEEEV